MRFSVLTPVYNPPVDALAECIESVRSQTHDDWELILVDDCSTNPQVVRILDDAAASDARIIVRHRSVNGGIVAASNDALALASGEFVALLDHDDTLAPDALERVEAYIEAYPQADYLYSDEDHLDIDGARISPFYKPDWSPERLRSQMYTSHLSTIRREVMERVGGFHTGFDGAQDHDLVLRVTEAARSIVHIPELLYHWRVGHDSVSTNADSKVGAFAAGRRAVQAHCDRMGIDAVVEDTDVAGCFRVRRRLTSRPLVSVIIPTAGTHSKVFGVDRAHVVEIVRDLIERTDNDNIEIVVVADRTIAEEDLAELRQIAGATLKLVWFEEPFNFSRKINLGAYHSAGELLLLLNDDIAVRHSDWLGEMVGLLQDPEVAMVGARLLFNDGTLQHAGHVYNGNPFHTFFQYGMQDGGPGSILKVTRESSGVTAACALVRRTVFDEVGGFCVELGGNYNDVDFCMKVRATGQRILWTPFSTLFHFESQSRQPTVTDAEFAFIHARWHKELGHDPYYNPNLLTLRDDYAYGPNLEARFEISVQPTSNNGRGTGTAAAFSQSPN